MIKVLFESSIFLYQKVGGVSKYIIHLHENLGKHKVSSKIFSPVTINDYLANKENIKYEEGDDANLLNFYKNASLYITLSNYEGFGLTLLEALKMKCPVVCSDIPVFKEIYRKSCKYVSIKNKSSIKNGIESILKSNKQQKKLFLQSKLITKQLTWNRCAYVTSEVYKKILKNEI